MLKDNWHDVCCTIPDNGEGIGFVTRLSRVLYPQFGEEMQAIHFVGRNAKWLLGEATRLLKEHEMDDELWPPIRNRWRAIIAVGLPCEEMTAFVYLVGIWGYEDKYNEADKDRIAKWKQLQMEKAKEQADASDH